jgi:Flp pilus assembly protein TadD
LQTAAAAHRSGKLEEALAGYERVLRLQPRNPEALRLKGSVLGSQAKWSEAITVLRAAVQAQPKSVEALYGLGNALQSHGDMGEAELAYRKALQLRPKFPEALCNLGNLLMAMNRWDEAVLVYRQAVSAKPAWATVWSNLSIAYRELGRIAEAVSAARSALDEDPMHRDALHGLGCASETAEDWPTALMAFRKLAMYHGPSAETHFRIGGVLRAQGLEEQAATELAKAAALEPHNADISQALAAVLVSLGRGVEADTVMARVGSLAAVR